MAIWDSILKTVTSPKVLPVLGAGAAGAIGNPGSTSTSMPIEPEGYKGIGDLLRQRATARLSTPFDTAGYEARGIGNVNNAYEGAGMALGNKLTASGLADSPIAGAAQGKFEATRAGSIADFLNTVPEVQRQAEMQDFGQVADFYGNSLGRSQKTSGTGGWQGAAGGVAEMLGQLYGQGILGGKNTPGGAGGGVFGGGPVNGDPTVLSAIGGVNMPGAPEFPGGLPGLASEFGPTGGGAGQGLMGPLGKAAGTAGSGITGALGTAGHAIGGGLSSLGGTLGALATNPITWGVAGGLVAAKLWMNSQAHRQADKLTGEGGIQNSLNHDLEELAKAVASGQMTQQQADPLRQQAFQHWAGQALEFGKSGDKQTVVNQMLSSYDWDPALKGLAAQYRAQLGGSNV